MKAQLAKQLLYYRELYEHYDIEKQNIKYHLQRAYELRYNTPHYCRAYESDIMKLERQLKEFPSFEDVKIIYSQLREECPHEIINVDKHQCMICHKETPEINIEHCLYYSAQHHHTSNYIFQNFLQEKINSCDELDIDLIDIMKKEFYNHKKILLIGGVMQDNPILFEEDNQEQVYQFLSALKHMYMEQNHDVSIVGTKRACFYSYPNEKLKTFQAFSNQEVKDVLNQLQNESYDYIIDTLEQTDLKQQFPNSVIISYFNENHIDIHKMQHYKIDYAFSTQTYRAHSFKFYTKDGNIDDIEQYKIYDIMQDLTLKKNR